MPQPYTKGVGKKSAVKNYRTPCKYFPRGRCTNPRCPYLHVQVSPDDQAVRLGAKTDNALSNDAAADVMKTMLKLFFEKQQSAIYNTEQSMLDLSSLSNHEDLQSVSPAINFNSKTFCQCLCRCVQELILPLPSTLSLEHNHISSMLHLAAAMRGVGLDTTLRVLSLAGNDIKTVEGVLALKPFARLTELSLTGNPVTEIAGYRENVTKQMPSLLVLDRLSTADAPLCLPWPSLKGLDAQRTAADPLPSTPSSLEAIYWKASSSPSVSIESNILKFLCMNVFGLFEYDELSRASNKQADEGNRVNELADVYTLQATLSLSLSCPEAAVATPLRSSHGQNPSTSRTVIREIVGFRMRQTESDHNLIRGVRSTRSAVGCVRVCTQLEHWLYPPGFVVKHYLHPDINIVNLGVGGESDGYAVSTVHGVMAWYYRTTGPTTGNNGGCNSDGLVIMRNFTRTFTLAPRVRLSGDDVARGNIPAERGWVIQNDMVTLMPFSGVEDENTDETLLVLNQLPPVILFGEKVHAYRVLFSPATDPRRMRRYSRRYDVPVSVVGVVCAHVHSDAGLVEVLTDLSGAPLCLFQELATLVDQDPIATLFLCRLHKCYGVEPDAGVEILRRCDEMDWGAIRRVIGNSVPGP